MTLEAHWFLDEQWQRLIDFLNSWCTATAVESGRIEVLLSKPGGHKRRATILMTPDQWDSMASVMWGNFDDAAQAVRRSVLSLSGNDRYLVFGDYELNPSPTADWPAGSGQVRPDED
jgi:hypothetical protein